MHHETVLELVRERPGFVPDLLSKLDVSLPPFTEARGEAKGKTEALLKILTKRGLSVTPHQQRQIHECSDLDTLDRWLDQALTTGSVDELLG